VVSGEAFENFVSFCKQLPLFNNIFSLPGYLVVLLLTGRKNYVILGEKFLRVEFAAVVIRH